MIECGEIYYVEGGKNKSQGSEIWSGRPAVIVSSKESIKNQGTVNVIYITSSDHKKNFSVKLSKEDFDEQVRSEYKSHVVLCAQIHSVDKSRLGRYFGKVSNDEMKQIKNEVGKVLF